MHLLPVFDAPAQFRPVFDAPAQFLPVSDAPAQGLVQSAERLDLVPQVTRQQTPRRLITIVVLPLQLHLAKENFFFKNSPQKRASVTSGQITVLLCHIFCSCVHFIAVHVFFPWQISITFP